MNILAINSSVAYTPQNNNNIKTKVTTATKTENFFKLPDLFQPDKKSIVIIDKIPTTKETNPTILGKVKSSAVTLIG